MLPGRQILKVDIEASFDILSSMGMHNLGDPIDALSTKQKVEKFSQQADQALGLEPGERITKIIMNTPQGHDGR